MGISRDSLHKRRATGGKQKAWRKKRKFELGRPSANTKLTSADQVCVRPVRCRGGNMKFRALRLDCGNFAWGSEAITRKVRILDVVYNASNNELVRTQTLVKNAIVQIDAAPFKQWYLQHYGTVIGKKKASKAAEEAPEEEAAKKSGHLQRKLEKRQADRKLESHVDEQFATGRLYACISSRPGQCGRISGYVLEGKELEFYTRKMQKKKGKAKSGVSGGLGFHRFSQDFRSPLNPPIGGEKVKRKVITSPNFVLDVPEENSDEEDGAQLLDFAEQLRKFLPLALSNLKDFRKKLGFLKSHASEENPEEKSR
ncbi:40S ribosomal protein [Cymbomonas tetramitiformis]|uniref:40S ribosomal protein S8 n=1 Tax=Cymbomonas tetramitiformis TaxID=36881 RepID=A0AAE0FMH4_9CHLO|nr:40S ribosomal protein [Cymbomonas tetramitiformis]